MDKKFLKENAPMYCVIPANLLLDDSKTTQEKMDLIMSMLEKQTKGAAAFLGETKTKGENK